jgi:hypothetical protein
VESSLRLSQRARQRAFGGRVKRNTLEPNFGPKLVNTADNEQLSDSTLSTVFAAQINVKQHQLDWGETAPLVAKKLWSTRVVSGFSVDRVERVSAR